MINAALIGSILTLSIAVITVAFRIGHLAARVEEVERWRLSMRADMHEISDKIGDLTSEVKTLSAIIKERTERRTMQR